MQLVTEPIDACISTVDSTSLIATGKGYGGGRKGQNPNATRDDALPKKVRLQAAAGEAESQNVLAAPGIILGGIFPRREFQQRNRRCFCSPQVADTGIPPVKCDVVATIPTSPGSSQFCPGPAPFGFSFGPSSHFFPVIHPKSIINISSTRVNDDSISESNRALLVMLCTFPLLSPDIPSHCGKLRSPLS